MKQSANLFVVASPSGGGKTSLVKGLLDKLDDIEVSISHTTRQQRDGEEHGKHYFFVNNDEFNALVDEGAFIESANVFGHAYGTAKEQIIDKLNKGIDVFLDIDWQGARQLKLYFDNVVSIFILPPSVDELTRRLTKRKQDSQKIIDSRMQKAQQEISYYSEFDYLIVNDDFQVALKDLERIICAERLRVERQAIKYQSLLSNLLIPK